MRFLRDLFRPERRWKGERALVPVESCYQILDKLLLLVGVVWLIGLSLVLRQAPNLITVSPLVLPGLVLQFLMILAAFTRGLGFLPRVSLLLFDMYYMMMATSVMVGPTPNWAFMIMIEVLVATLIFGMRTGLIVLVFVIGSNALVGWGWVIGYLPIFMPSRAAALSLTDPTRAQVWARFVVMSAGAALLVVVIIWYVLGELEKRLRGKKAALAEANRMLERLAVEQEHRVRAEEGRLIAEREARELQKFDALGRMASGVAHDFNNALCVIKCWSGMLADDPTADAATMREALGEIKRASVNAEQLTSHLLAYSRSDVGRREVASLTSVIQHDCRTLSRILPKNIVVVTQLGEEVHVPLGTGQLQELLLNLAINARDAMPQGGRLIIQAGPETLHAATHSRSPGRYARLTVTDTGTGMDETIQARIFEPFFTTKGPGRGTGLGLSMVFGLVSGAGGSIKVQSRLGEGSSFTIMLPAVDPDEAASELRVPTVLTPMRCRVLVVDKQLEIGMLIERILTQDGFPCVRVSEGQAALREFSVAGSRFGLLIVQGVLPEVSTEEIIAAARQRNPLCKIIILSAPSMDAKLVGDLESGVYHLLHKPFDQNQLRRVVTEAMISENENTKLA